MADFSRETREHWLKQHFSKNEVAKSGDEPELTLPHPRARQRAFVLEPLAEVLPGFRWPDMV